MPLSFDLGHHFHDVFVPDFRPFVLLWHPVWVWVGRLGPLLEMGSSNQILDLVLVELFLVVLVDFGERCGSWSVGRGHLWDV